MKRIIKDTKSVADIDADEILYLATKVVNRYVAKGSIPRREMEDIKMTIVENFIVKKHRLLTNYKGESKLSTYCISVLNNMCKEAIRRNLKSWTLQNNIQQKEDVLFSLSSLDMLAIRDEINYLNKIILLFVGEKYKIRLFTAYYILLEMLENDIVNYDKNYLVNKTMDLLEINDSMSKETIFINLSQLVNRVELKNTKPDAVRMWLNKTSYRIIKRLNMGNEKANYNLETYHILFEYYYTNKIYH